MLTIYLSKMHAYLSFANWLVLMRVFWMPGTMWTSLAASHTSNLNSLMSSAAATCPLAYLDILSDLRPVELNRLPLILKRPQV